MSSAGIDNTEPYKENINSNNLLSPLRNNNIENQSFINYNYKEQNTPILDYNTKYSSPKNIDISSQIYPNKHSEYPYYFKYSNSTKGDDFHKTKKYYPSFHGDNQINSNNNISNNQDILQSSNAPINGISNKDNDYDFLNEHMPITPVIREGEINHIDIHEKDNFNNWYTKFKNSNFYNGRNEKINKNIIKTNGQNDYNFIPSNKINLYNNEEDILRKDNYINDKNNLINNEIKNISLLFKKINSQNNDFKEPYLIKNKYSELF